MSFVFGHLPDERQQAANMPISEVSVTDFAVLCCGERPGKRKPDCDLISQVNVDNITNTVDFRRAMERRKLFGKVGGKKRYRLQDHNRCKAVLWLLLTYTLSITLLSISKARFMTNLPQCLLLLLYILASALAMQRFWCECASLPSLECLLQPALGSHIATHGGGDTPAAPPSLATLFEWRQHMDVELCHPTSSGWGCLGKENLTDLWDCSFASLFGGWWLPQRWLQFIAVTAACSSWKSVEHALHFSAVIHPVGCYLDDHKTLCFVEHPSSPW